MADGAILLFCGSRGGIKTFSFDVGHDNAIVAVIIIRAIIFNLPVTV